MQDEVGGRHGQHHAGHAADGEGHDEPDRPQHHRGEADTPAIHGEQPVEDLHPRRHRDDHRRDAEKAVHIGACPHGEEMVQPDHERQDADHHGRDDH